MNQTKIILLVSGIIKNNQDQILVLLRGSKNNNFKGLWQLPEGKVEYGESLEAALKREVTEETSLNLTHIQLQQSTVVHLELEATRYTIVRLIYQVDWVGNVSTSEEHTAYSWVNADEFNNLTKIPGIEGIKI